MNTPKILIYDIETSPIEGTVWGTYEQDLLWMDRDWHILTISWKWLGEKKTHVFGLPDFPLYKKDPRNDRELVRLLRGLFDTADIVLAHNGDRFDQKKAQARMIIQGFDPPAPYRQIDTLKVAKKYFAFSSNRLDDLGEYLGVGRKLETGGKYLWKSCLAGDIKAWNKMKKYNRQDVLLLEKVYLKLRPWMENHPNLTLLNERPESCPKCQGGPMQARGYRYNGTTKYQRFQCTNCKGWCRARKSEKVNLQFA